MYSCPITKVQLNKNSIFEVQSAILEAFKENNDDKSPYAMLNKHYGKYYYIIQESIQKFPQELNGSMIRTVSSNDIVVNVPWSLILKGITVCRKISESSDLTYNFN